MRSKSRKRQSKPIVPEAHLEDEPAVEDGHGWVECGGELILAQGFTEAGFPYGTTLEEFREANLRDSPRAGWARARRAIERVCSAELGRQVEADFVKFQGSGLSRDAFRTTIGERDVYALVPNRFASADYNLRAVAELRLLDALGKRELGFRVPKVFGALRDSGGVILVEELLAGAPLDFRVGAQPAIKPWCVVAELAAQIHSLPIGEFPAGLLTPRDCRTHGESLVPAAQRELLLHAAREWMLAHLPPPEPGVLLHGDLLGQNIHLGLGEPAGVLDWERAEIGDPAYDFAVVTRGARRVFQMADGLSRMLEAYSMARGSPLSRSRVEFFELALTVRRYERAIADAHDVEGAGNRLSSLLKRVGAL